MEKEMRVKTIPGAIRKKEKQAKSFHGVTYPQSCAFCLFLVYKIFFKFGIMPKAGVGVKSNELLRKIEGIAKRTLKKIKRHDIINMQREQPPTRGLTKY